MYMRILLQCEEPQHQTLLDYHMELEAWATEKLSVFLGFDPETLRTQVMPYLMSFSSAEELTEHLTDMLGTNADSLSFIQEFATRRFLKSHSRKTSEEKKSVGATITQETPSHFPSLPKSSMSSDSQWPSNINVYVKNAVTDDEYFSSGRKPKKNSKAAKAKSSENLTQTAKQAQSTLVSDRLEKKPKKKNDMTLETALKELDINASGSKGKRKEQQVMLIAEAKKKRSEEKQRLHQQQQQRRSKAAATPMVGYASKVSGGFSSRHFESVWDEAQEEDSRRRAEEHKEKLLEFQRTSAKRSTVIDQATDFTLPTDTSNPWLSPQERALQMKKQQANLKRLEAEGRSRRRVMTIDVQTRQVKVEEAESLSSESEEEVVVPSTKKPENSTVESAGTYANNPLLKNLQGPKFINRNHKETKGRNRRKQRVQYEDKDLADLMFVSSVADERDITVEPMSCLAK
ncbi:hypothetical protein EC973_001274 [Apophysomyces ossiformis]|uniref:Uncharacterized protein n=1 Tax=Apophysomyces ossiformis TaxID=679940 RepID=A0A8H7ENM9_9FUNG|nr:hypothetical protein EC973_001274 [Apophysomyces ossiformis]